MLWGHCIQYSYQENADFYLNLVFKFIYSFHMPFFMLISGYLFALSTEKKNKQLFRRKCGTLISTIIGGSLFLFLMNTAFFECIDGNFSILIDGKWMSSFWELWFLWSVLASTTYLSLIRTYFRDVPVWTELLLLFWGFIFVMFFPHWQKNVFLYPYFVIGCLYRRYYQKILTLLVLRYPLSVLFLVSVCFYGKKHYIYTSGIYGDEYSLMEYIRIDIFRYIIGLLGCVFVLTLIILLKKCTDRLFIWKYTAQIGEKSLQMYVLSVVFLSSYFAKIIDIAAQHIPQFMIWTQNIFSRTLITFLIAGGFTILLNKLTDLLYKVKIGPILFGR